MRFLERTEENYLVRVETPTEGEGINIVEIVIPAHIDEGEGVFRAQAVNIKVVVIQTNNPEDATLATVVVLTITLLVVEEAVPEPVTSAGRALRITAPLTEEHVAETKSNVINGRVPAI